MSVLNNFDDNAETILHMMTRGRYFLTLMLSMLTVLASATQPSQEVYHSNAMSTQLDDCYQLARTNHFNSDSPPPACYCRLMQRQSERAPDADRSDRTICVSLRPGTAKSESITQHKTEL